MSRMDAIEKEQKDKESGNYGIERKWYIDQDALDKHGIEQYRAKVGSNFLSIVPPSDPDAYFGLRIFVHYNIGPNNDAFLCPRMMLGEACVICERQDQLKAAEADEDVIKALSCFPPRYLFLAVDETSEETAEKGPQLYDAPQTVNNEILGLSKNRKTGETIDISDPDKGKMLIFDRTGTKAHNTRYSAFELEKREPLADNWLKVPSIEDLLYFATEAEMLKSLGASVRKADPEDEGTDTADEGTDTGGRRSRGARSGRSSRQSSEAKSEETPSGCRSRRSEPSKPEEAEEKSGDEQDDGTTRRRPRIPRDEEPASDEAPADDKGGEGEAADSDVKSRLRDRLKKRRASQED